MWNAEQVRAIESIVMEDGRAVREFLSADHPVPEIARRAGEGIRREGSRCLENQSEARQGNDLCDELAECHTIESLIRLCASFYTRDSFLYRRVNAFLRSTRPADDQTVRNLGLYVGLLREGLCVWSESSPIQWEHPQLVYRGASFDVDAVVDYARRSDEIIRWQSFTSTSSNIQVALGFPGNVLFEISVARPVASLGSVSVFKSEQEFVLSPYQWFIVNDVRWESTHRRWLLSIRESSSSPPDSWLDESLAAALRAAKKDASDPVSLPMRSTPA
jgi:hypothetical protein